jgi:NitT/TauT family transport system substrate-binding protein
MSIAPRTGILLVAACLACACESSKPGTSGGPASGGPASAPATGPASAPATGPASAPAAGANSAALAKLTVAAIPIVDVAPIYLGRQKGFFAEQGLEIEIQSTQGGAATVPGVLSGQFQFGFANMVSLLIAHTKGLPVKVLAAGNASTGKAGADFNAIVVPAGSPIKTAKDLEGKTVASNNLNNIGDVTMRVSVRKAGGDPSKVKFVELPFPDMPAALADHRLDATWIVEPFLTVAKNQGAVPIASNLVDTAPELMVAAYFTTVEYAQKNPDVVRRFTAAINKSLGYTQAHPDEARAILLSYTKIAKPVADALTLPTWSEKINKDSTRALADLLVQDKLVDHKPDVDALLP